MLRTSLLPSLLECVVSNLCLDELGPRLFEIGRVYLPCKGDLPKEREMLVIAMAGPGCQRGWSERTLELDFYELKGGGEELLVRLNLEGPRFFRTASQDLLLPGRELDIA